MNFLSFFKLQFILWILPIAVIIQNIEVSSRLYSWLIHHAQTFHPLVTELMGDVYASTFKDQLNTSLFIASILPLLVVSFFNRTNNKSFTRYILTIAGFVIMIGAMTKMVLVLLFQSYVPGVVTAMFLCLPLSFRLVKYCFDTFNFTYIIKVLVFIVSIIIYLPLTWAIWNFSSIIIF